MLYLLVTLIGILAGGLVNILADDLPERRTPRLPRYPDDTPRPVSAWLGLTAFLLGQRTSPNGVKLPWRYPLTELLTAGLMVLAVYAAQTRDDVDTPQLIFWLIYMVFSVLVTVIDIEHKLILFVVVIPFGLVALLDALVTTPSLIHPDISSALLGGLLGFVIFFLLYNGGFLFTYVLGKLRGRTITDVAFGYGDVMLMTVGGFILGWRSLIFAIILISIFGAIGAIIYMIARRSRYTAFTALPYGPYIIMGIILMMLFGSEIGSFVLGAL